MRFSDELLVRVIRYLDLAISCEIFSRQKTYYKKSLASAGLFILF